MLAKVISGGQSGADLAGWRAARRFSIPTGGWVPKGFLTEDGPHPEFATLYGAVEHESPEYPPRTRANVRDADALLWFGDTDSPGGRLTMKTIQGCGEFGKPYLIIRAATVWHRAEVAAWLGDPVRACKTLLVAGNRESKAPGIGAWVEAYLCEVFRLLGHEEVK